MFEFDKLKSELNFLKHGISLEEATKLWLDQNMIIGPASSTTEERWVAVGKILSKYWLVVFTYRGNNIRIITCRKAREEEKIIDEQSK